MQFGGHGKILRIRRAAPQDSALCTQGRGASESQQHALGTAAREGGPGTYKRGVGIVVLRKTEAPLRAAQARVVARAPRRGRIGRVQQPHLVPRGVVLLGVVGHRVPWRHRRSLPLRPTTPSAQLKKTTASAHTVQHSIRPKRGAPHARTRARTHARTRRSPRSARGKHISQKLLENQGARTRAAASPARPVWAGRYAYLSRSFWFRPVLGEKRRPGAPAGVCIKLLLSNRNHFRLRVAIRRVWQTRRDIPTAQ